MLYMKGFKIIINEAEAVLAAIPDGILNFILALDNSGVLLFVGGIDPARYDRLSQTAFQK